MIYETDFQQQIENAFLTYGASVAQERSIPDVRDMLKIGLRQGLYAQYSNKLTHKDKFQKAQKSVASAMSQSYVHGDAAMYDTFIRAAKPWAYRYPVEEAQGAYGSPAAPDDHSAPRYVEMRSGELADFFFSGLKKNAITEWYPNYDDTEMIPSVFPSIGFWNVVNGCSGIAVAMATSVPAFNLREVNNALIKIIQDPNVSYDEIYCAPDFPCGGTITNARAVKESLRLGKGEAIRIKANLQYVPEQNMIQATELPYGVFTNTIISQLAELTNDNPTYGIERVIDHTKKTADIRIYLSKGVNPKKMIDKLYHDTSLENWFSINMIMLDHGRFPKLFGWRAACDAYIEHIRECKRNMIQFDLDKAMARLNVVEGLLIAAVSIDTVVAIIRGSNDPTEASTKLIARFGFNQEQTKAILAMKLASLTKIDAIKLDNEREELIVAIEQFRYLLNTPTALDEELIKILVEVATKYGDDRRTRLQNIVEAENDQPQIEEEEVSLMLFDNNMLRIMKKDDIQGAKRGRKGVNIKPPKSSTLINTLYTTNLGLVSAFTNRGRMYNFSLNELDLNKDYSIYEVIAPQPDEKVILLIDTTSFNSYKNLITVSKNGYIKKSAIREYNLRAKKGTAAVKLEDNDVLVGVYLSSNDEDRVFVVSNNGYYNFYDLSNITATGRTTKGVKAIKLEKDEYIRTATIIKKNINYTGILTITTTGRGKITTIEDFNETSRGIKGSKVMNLKDEQLALVYAVPASQEQIFVSSNNKAVLLETNSIPIQNRMTAGVRIIDARGSETTIEIM